MQRWVEHSFLSGSVVLKNKCLLRVMSVSSSHSASKDDDPVVQVCDSVWNGRSLSLCEEVRISYGSVTTSVRWHLHCFLLLGAEGGNFYAARVWEL
jgi:hypothetical protein